MIWPKIAKHKTNFSFIYKKGKDISMFSNIEIRKKNYHHKNPIFLKDVDVEKVLLVSTKIFSRERNYKYFIGRMYDDQDKSLHIILLKTGAYVKHYDWQIKWMYFLKITNYQKNAIIL